VTLVTTTDLGPDQERPTRRWRPTSRVVFFAIMLVVLVGYTEMAFELVWTAPGGRIGPGVFPRITGVLATLITAGVLINSLRTGAGDDEGTVEEEVGEGELGRHPVPLVLTVVLCAGFLFTLTWLGAIIAGTLFMFGMLAILNTGRWVANAVFSLTIPFGLYLLLQTALNAGLPEGILPRF
jgi:putative tricarboxylic transport membrane protein